MRFSRFSYAIRSPTTVEHNSPVRGRDFALSSDTWAFAPIYEGFEDIPQLWVEAFRLRNASGEPSEMTSQDVCHGPDEVFGSTLLVLARLRHHNNSDSEMSFKYLQFLGKMHPEFRRLMYEKEERALWVFGYWLGLLCRVEDGTWWCVRRARRDYKAILIHLQKGAMEKKDGLEGEVWRKMILEYESLR